MIIIYEQGDIVYNSNNLTYGVVINESSDGEVRILECGGKDVFINYPSKSALKYCGHLDFKKNLRDMLLSYVEPDKLEVRSAECDGGSMKVETEHLFSILEEALRHPATGVYLKCDGKIRLFFDGCCECDIEVKNYTDLRCDYLSD